MFLWNFWGMYGDLFDKVVVFVTFAALTGIGTGAHAAFTTARSYVAISSFLASAVPLFFNLYFSKKERLLRNNNNLFNHNVFNMSLQAFTVIPYFAAAFVGTERAARFLFWIPPVAQIVLSYLSYEIFSLLHRNRTSTSRVAVSFPRRPKGDAVFEPRLRFLLTLAMSFIVQYESGEHRTFYGEVRSLDANCARGVTPRHFV